MAALIPVARIQYTDGNGQPLIGGTVAFCQPNTSGTVFLPVWADEAATIQLTNPVPLDSAGITFSGGSQVSVWGTGVYEEFVRDSNGNLIYSAEVESPLSANNPNITGDLHVTGNITAGGNISAGGNLNAAGSVNGSSANISGNITSGSLNTGNITDTGNLTVNGNTNIGGNLGVGGHLTVGNGADISNGLTVDSGNLNLNGNNIDNVGTLTANVINASQINSGTQASNPSFRGGTGPTAANGALVINFSPPFNNAQAVVACEVGPNWLNTTTAVLLNNSQAVAYCFADNGSPLPGVILNWIAVGT